jgi:hypothetical protein
MKINKLETHDRLEHFKKDQSQNLFEGVDDCARKNKDCVAMQQHFPYVYIFAHPRTADDGANKRMIYQPRLTKPKAQTNSYLFRLLSNTDIVEIVWMLPPRELWGQYEKGKLTESDDVLISIWNFTHKRDELEKPHKDDWSEDRIRKKLESIQAKETKC